MFSRGTFLSPFLLNFLPQILVVYKKIARVNDVYFLLRILPF